MAINISGSLIKKLPEKERESLEEFLWKKSGGKCGLCEEKLNRAADSIEADHEVPESEGGKNTRDNLNLAHVTCNRAKRATPTVDVRPYLKLSAYMRRKGGFIRYDGSLDHFGIKPKESVLEFKTTTVRFELPDGSEREVPRLADTAKGDHPHVFVDLPRAAIYNDDECQPRTIKQPQIWAIYSDLKRNPLHEPPGCRLVKVRGKNRYQIKMFDGQHKTIATWMKERDRVVAKVYLDLSQEATIELVNSIQSKIKKLPLSPFEVAAKMADEWAHKLESYVADAGVDKASEQGFIAWLPSGPERTRGKDAFKAALLQNLLSSDDLRLLDHVQRAGGAKDGKPITENALKTKILEKLLHLDPLSEPAEEADKLRTRERDNIVRGLNLLNDLVFEIPEGADAMAEAELERVKRMSYQAALQYIAGLIRALYGHIFAVGETGREMMEREPSDEQWQRIESGIQKLVTHPAWSADWDGEDTSARLKELKQALQKNQDVQRIFPKLGLKLAYLVGVEPLDAEWWK